MPYEFETYFNYFVWLTDCLLDLTEESAPSSLLVILPQIPKQLLPVPNMEPQSGLELETLIGSIVFNLSIVLQVMQQGLF